MMKKLIYLLLCAAIIIGCLSACTPDDKNDENNTAETPPHDENEEDDDEPEDIVIIDRLAAAKEIFLNPAVDVNTRIETFISVLFTDPKIAFFENFDNMTEELNQFVFMIGVYKGIVHRYTGKIGEGLTKEMIEENIQAVFGSDVISKLDYSYIPADYDAEQEIYIPWVYGALNNALRYVFYDIEQMDYDIDRPQYSVKISYIDVNGNLLAYDTNGDRICPPEYITEMEDGNREEAIEEFKKEIMQNPQYYERTRLYVEVGNDYINLLSARQINNTQIIETETYASGSVRFQF